MKICLLNKEINIVSIPQLGKTRYYVRERKTGRERGRGKLLLAPETPSRGVLGAFFTTIFVWTLHHQTPSVWLPQNV